MRYVIFRWGSDVQIRAVANTLLKRPEVEGPEAPVFILDQELISGVVIPPSAISTGSSLVLGVIDTEDGNLDSLQHAIMAARGMRKVQLDKLGRMREEIEEAFDERITTAILRAHGYKGTAVGA